MKLVNKLENKELTALNWVAEVARLLPDATFAGASRPRDGKHRIHVTYMNDTYECIITEDTPEAVAAALLGPCLRCGGSNDLSCGCPAGSRLEKQ